MAAISVLASAVTSIATSISVSGSGLGLGLRHSFSHGFGFGLRTFNVLGAHGLEVLLTALFLFVGLLGALGGLGLVLALGKRSIPGLVGDDGGIQAAAFKDGQLNAVVKFLEQLARGLKAQVISSHGRLRRAPPRPAS